MYPLVATPLPYCGSYGNGAITFDIRYTAPGAEPRQQIIICVIYLFYLVFRLLIHLSIDK